MTSDSSDGNNAPPLFFLDLMRKKVTRLSLTESDRKGPAVGAGISQEYQQSVVGMVLWSLGGEMRKVLGTDLLLGNERQRLCVL